MINENITPDITRKKKVITNNHSSKNRTYSPNPFLTYWQRITDKLACNFNKLSITFYELINETHNFGLKCR